MDLDKLKKYFWLRSISVRLHLFIIVTIAFTVLLVSYLDSRVSVRLINSEIESNATLMASRLAEDLARPDAPAEPAIIQNWLRRSMESGSYIARIDLFRLSGDTPVRFVTTSAYSPQTLSLHEAAAIRDGTIRNVSFFQDREAFLKIIVPFTDSAGVKSCVSLVASLREANLIGKIHNEIAWFLVPASILLTMILLNFLFRRLLVRRFDRLIAAMNQASKGTLEVRAPVEHEDEIGIIARRYNEMMEQIELASRERSRLLEEQKSFNIQLTGRVQEATREISAKNETLRQVNEDLLDTQLRLTQAERAAVAGQMAATFAHEIGSPLSAITTHLELMLENKSVSDDARRRLNLIQEQVNRITGFVEELLSQTRSPVKARTTVQINQLLQQLLLFLEQHLARKLVKLETRFASDLPDIEANPQQLQQVFLNLLNNACDAMPNGGTVLVETYTGSDSTGKYLVVSVKDNGTGIPPEKQARIFEPFFTTKDLRRGTGLGLSIAAEIVRQHKGTIDVQSTPGSGSTFTIRIQIPAPPSRKTQEVLAGKELS